MRNTRRLWGAPLMLGAFLFPIGCQRQPQSGATTAPTSRPGGPAAAIKTPTGLDLVLIPAGEFAMGAPQDVDARPVHRVAVSGFYMGKFEVTQELYERVMGKNLSTHKGKSNPVERLSWLDAITFCNTLSTLEKRRPCYDLKTRQCNFAADGYRLPTEAEWEYACRAGSTGDYYFGSKEADLPAHAWFKGNAGNTTHPVGGKRANAFGLYDMAGNVREYCNDWYQVDAYKQDARAVGKDPRGPASGDKKVLRGGAFSVRAKACTSWARFCQEPGFTDACVVSDDCGFRCVRRP